EVTPWISIDLMSSPLATSPSSVVRPELSVRSTVSGENVALPLAPPPPLSALTSALTSKPKSPITNAPACPETVEPPSTPSTVRYQVCAPPPPVSTELATGGGRGTPPRLALFATSQDRVAGIPGPPVGPIGVVVRLTAPWL